MADDRLAESPHAGDVESLMDSARSAFRTWREIPMTERAFRIGDLQEALLRNRDALVERICSETGKTPVEALHSDLLPTLEMIRYLQKHAAQVLRTRRVATPLIFPSSTSRVEYRPRGVVLVIAPWNNPLQLSLVPAAFALAAGNTVILKPSERTPGTGELIGELFQQAGLVGSEIQIASGGPEAARALIGQRPDMVFFTGGGRNGREVLAAATRHLIPVILELGGKDPMIVFADADRERASRAAIYGSFAHAGQHCVSVKRLYIEAPIYDDFLERVVEQARVLAGTSEWGRVVDGRARATAAEQVRGAIERGGRLLVPADADRAGVEPTIVADVTQAMRLVQEETFAPVLAAARFRTEEEAVEMANDCAFGLNASVWSQDRARCERVVQRLDTGNAYVNNVLINVGNPLLPFGGVKGSGFGRYHGLEGIRAFCVETSVMTSRSRRTAEPNWFPHDERSRGIVEALMDVRYGKMSLWRRVAGWLHLFRRS